MLKSNMEQHRFTIKEIGDLQDAGAVIETNYWNPRKQYVVVDENNEIIDDATLKLNELFMLNRRKAELLDYFQTAAVMGSITDIMRR